MPELFDHEAAREAARAWVSQRDETRRFERAAEFLESNAQAVIGVLLNGDAEQVLGLAYGMRDIVEADA